MTRYRLEAETIVDEQDLIAMIAAITGAGIEVKLHPVIEADTKTIGEIAHALHPAPAPITKPAPKARAKRGNGGEWPAEGSIYSVVMKALDNGAMTPSELRDVLKEGGFSPGSLGSALGRLEKQKKALRLEDGRWGPL
jgi:hypothetical protein